MKQEEHEHQKALMQWVSVMEYRYPFLRLMYAIPNGGARDVRVGKKLKAEGVKRGVPDLCLPVACKEYHGLYIEMKTQKGRMSKEQTQWNKDLKEQGYHAVVARGWDEAKSVILDYINKITINS